MGEYLLATHNRFRRQKIIFYSKEVLCLKQHLPKDWSRL